MSMQTLLGQLKAQGIRVEPRPNGLLHLTPKERVTPDLLDAVREHKTALLVHLRGVRSISPDSRSPLIAPEIRVKIEGIEEDARSKGWPAELLWSAAFWDRPRGLAAVLEADDEIAGVMPDYIEILKRRLDLLRFRRFAG